MVYEFGWLQLRLRHHPSFVISVVILTQRSGILPVDELPVRAGLWVLRRLPAGSTGVEVFETGPLVATVLRVGSHSVHPIPGGAYAVVETHAGVGVAGDLEATVEGFL